MSNVTQSNPEFMPAIIAGVGKTLTERKADVAHNASLAATLALSGVKGAVGKIARASTARYGIDALFTAACKSNFRPVAEYIAAQTGEPVVISSRAAFESLPDMMEARVMKAKQSKSGGFSVSKKDGSLKPSAALSLAMSLKSEMTELVARVAEFHAGRKESLQAPVSTEPTPQAAPAPVTAPTAPVEPALL